MKMQEQGRRSPPEDPFDAVPRSHRSADTQPFRAIAASVFRTHPVADFALWAAGLTFFGAIGILPFVMETISIAGRVFGKTFMRNGLEHMLLGIPDRHDAREGVRTLFTVSLGLSWMQLAVILVPATLYGEGLRRALLQLSRDHPTASTGWRGRIAIIPLIVLGAFGLGLAMFVAPTVGPRYRNGGWDLVLAVVLAFHLTFAALGVSLTFVYRYVAAASINTKAALGGGLCAASVIAGFLQGFLVFLAIPVDWSSPFGGVPVLGPLAALLFWLYGLHLLVLLGYRVALFLDRIKGDELPPSPLRSEHRSATRVPRKRSTAA